MHRHIDITVPSGETLHLVNKLRAIDAVITLAVVESASVKPPGDVIQMQVLNCGTDDVMRAIQEVAKTSRVIVATSDIDSIADAENQEEIENDTDEELWEEIETGLRQTTHITSNYVILMALGGVVASAGLVMHGVEQAIAFVAASIIAPGFEPIAKIPVGMVLKSRAVVVRALTSFAAGYAVLSVAAGITFAALRAAGVAKIGEIASNKDIQHVMDNAIPENILSFCGALAGLVMLTSYREEVIAGPILALAIVPACALTAAGVVTANGPLFSLGAIRLLIDLAVIFGTAAVFMWMKQRLVHKRQAMV